MIKRTSFLAKSLRLSLYSTLLSMTLTGWAVSQESPATVTPHPAVPLTGPAKEAARKADDDSTLQQYQMRPGATVETPEQMQIQAKAMKDAHDKQNNLKAPLTKTVPSPQKKASNTAALQTNKFSVESLALNNLPDLDLTAATDPNHTFANAEVSMQPDLSAWNQVLGWNHVALDLTAIDHTLTTGGGSLANEQFGPPRLSRAMALLQLGIFETANLFDLNAQKTSKYESFKAAGSGATVQQDVLNRLHVKDPSAAIQGASESSALATVATELLGRIFPKKDPYTRILYKGPDDIAIDAGLQAAFPDPIKRRAYIESGTALGKVVADAIWSLPQGGQQVDAALDSDICADLAPGATVWSQDPLNPSTKKLGCAWSKLPTFVIPNASSFRVKPYPAPGTPAWKKSLDLSRDFGGDPNAFGVSRYPTPTLRTPDETLNGTFWAYDTSPGLCAPPRLYNMIITSIATKEMPVKRAVEMARLLALANVAMADVASAAWESKWYYSLGRPVTVIRNLGQSEAEKNWTPLGAPVTNGTSRNVTPPFPAYPSGHAAFGGALFETLRTYFDIGAGDAGTQFHFVSDEFNGQNQDPRTGAVRPYKEVALGTFGEAEQANAMSRIYLGLHWTFDADAAIDQGHQVGKAVVCTALKSSDPSLVPARCK